MRLRLVTTLLLTAICSPVLGQQASETEKADAPSFIVRVNPKWRAEVNDVLSRLAQRLTAVVPSGQTPEEYLTRYCGYQPAFQKLETLDSGVRVLVAPCARVRRNVEIEATVGDTLEGLAVRNGLPRTAAESLKVIPSGEGKARSISPQELQIGDRVILPEVPLWSPVVVNPDVAADRDALVSALAEGLGCGDEDQEECLAKRDVSVLSRGRGRKEDRPALPPIERENWLPNIASQISADACVMELRIDALGALVAAPSASLEETPPPPPPLAGVAVAAPPAAARPDRPDSIPVALKQWPYDADLVAAILEKAMDAGQIQLPTTIGIADGGLGNASGNPLPDTVFDIGNEKRGDDQNREPDGDDNDCNEYVDDFFGAGIARLEEDELLGTGDLGLCKSNQPPFSTWNPGPLREASHGAVVSSVAAALGLRHANPRVAGVLPKMVFFRMLENACTEDADFRPSDGQLVVAFQYLATRAQVVNISELLAPDGNANDNVRSVLGNSVRYDGVLLVVSAGNDGPGDLDTAENCPPCLGNDMPDRGGTAAKRTLVVGAATRDLHRPKYSNYGERTVGIFAPGEPTGALNLAEKEVPFSAADGATSYAAPLVALAAAIVRSFGGPHITPMDIRDRLMAATWPLDDPESRPEKTHVGVLDLVKAAAVRMHAVEVAEKEPDGREVRRTYVGDLLTPLKTLSLCPSRRVFQEAAVQAIRLDAPDHEKERRLLVYHRSPELKTNRRRIETVFCQPEGELTIDALKPDGTTETKTFPLSEVTQIQLPWLR